MQKEKLMMTPCVALPLERKELTELVEKAKDWALMHGMLIRSKTNFSKEGAQFAPFALLPSSFPRKEFENACQIQLILNTLLHTVAHDYNFLKETFKAIIEVDSFTAKLFEIYETVHEEGFTQKISLGLLRSDLMLQSDCCNEGNSEIRRAFCCWKQVEINTIASGFGWLGPSATNLHKYVLGELGLAHELHNIPENKALEGLCSGMIEAWKIYGDPKSVILFVVEDVPYNICDQRFHEFEIRRQNSNVRVIRKTLTQLAVAAKLGNNKELLVNGTPVAVVYFRCGYEPGQYHTHREWDVRLMIERSLAIKSPSIQYHLAGSKKVQQALAKPGVVARYLKNEESAARIKEIFTNLYSLELDEHGDAAMKMAISEPDRFVLKPQREGGGNNVYGNDIKVLLESIKSQRDRAAYILMSRIYPPVQMNYLIRPSSSTNLELKEVCTELGIFGVVIGDSNHIILNKQAGHMLRAKLASSNEGGVMSGTALPDVIHAVPKYEVDHEPREIFFFREGTVIMWNIPELESGNIIQFLKTFEDSRYSNAMVQAESEMMSYTYTEPGKKSHLKDGDIHLSQDATNLEKYTFSNAIAQSLRLGIWEASLDHYIDSIEFVTEDLKAGRKIKMSREEVLRKQGELFALRHRINLSSDLLDTPDFYWERDDLESLYQQTCSYFSIAKRTRVMNEKINHCVELVELLSSHLSDRHHVRLEWMIIVLIMVEVGFETLHYLDRYLAKQDPDETTSLPNVA